MFVFFILYSFFYILLLHYLLYFSLFPITIFRMFRIIAMFMSEIPTSDLFLVLEDLFNSQYYKQSVFWVNICSRERHLSHHFSVMSYHFTIAPEGLPTRRSQRWCESFPWFCLRGFFFLLKASVFFSSSLTKVIFLVYSRLIIQSRILNWKRSLIILFNSRIVATNSLY